MAGKNKADSPEEGLGLIMCAACGDPLRDHAVAQPCPSVGRGDLPFVTPKRGRKPNKKNR